MLDQITDKSRFFLDILDWVLEEQLAGRRPTSVDVASHFRITVDRAEEINNELEAMGEF